MTCYELKQLEDAIETALHNRETCRGRSLVVKSEDERWWIEYNPRKAVGKPRREPCHPMSCIWWKWHECIGKKMQQNPLPRHLWWHVPCVELQGLRRILKESISNRNNGMEQFTELDSSTGWSIAYSHNSRVGLIGQLMRCPAKVMRCPDKGCRWYRVKECQGKSTEELIAERRQGV